MELYSTKTRLSFALNTSSAYSAFVSPHHDHAKFSEKKKKKKNRLPSASAATFSIQRCFTPPRASCNEALLHGEKLLQREIDFFFN